MTWLIDKSATLQKLVLCVLLVTLLGCGSSDGAAISVELVPRVCSPVGIGGGAKWASTCDGGSIVNVDTGARQKMQCTSSTARARVRSIFAVASDSVALFGCVDGTNPARTMLQSLAEHAELPPIDMGFSADIKAAAYSASGGGAIIVLAGKCNGLLAYRLQSANSLFGKMVPIARVSIGAASFELDAGRSYATAPPCSELSAVRSLGASADGSLVALGLVAPAAVSIFERPTDVFVGAIELETADGGVVLKGNMVREASGLRNIGGSIGVAHCDAPTLLLSDGSDQLWRYADRKLTGIKLQPGMPWGDLALSDDGSALLALTEVPFESGDVYEAHDVSVC